MKRSRYCRHSFKDGKGCYYCDPETGVKKVKSESTKQSPTATESTNENEESPTATESTNEESFSEADSVEEEDLGLPDPLRASFQLTYMTPVQWADAQMEAIVAKNEILNLY